MSWFLRLALASCVAAMPLAGCADKACIDWSADWGECPSADQAEALMLLACGGVTSVDSPGERTDDGLCCYDVTEDDSEVCSMAPRSPPMTTGTGVTSTSSGGGACDGSGFCSTCVSCAEAGSCADEKLACDANPSCTTLRTCVESCAEGDIACVDACKAGHPQGVEDLRTLYTCLVCDVCLNDCGAASVCGG